MGVSRRATGMVAFAMTVAAFAVLPAAGVHAAGWSKPKQVAGGAGGDVFIAENARGDTVLAWAGAKRNIGYAYRRAGHGFSRARLVPGGMHGPNAVAVDPAGGFAIAWIADDGAHVLLREAGRRRASSRLLSPAGERVFWLSLAAGGPGTFAAAWSGGEGQVEGARADRGHPFGAVTQVSRYEHGDSIRVVFAPGGRAVVLWSTGEVNAVRAAVWPSKGSPEAPGTVETAAGRGFVFLTWTVAADARGRQTLLWSAAGDTPGEEVAAASGQAPSPFTPVQQLAAGPILTDTQLAVASSGVAVAAWRTGYDTVHASLRPPGAAAFGPPRDFRLPQGSGLRVSSAAVAPNGRSAVGWSWSGGVNVTVGTQSGFGSPTMLSRSLVPPVVAVDRRGNVTAAWVDGDKLMTAAYGT